MFCDALDALARDPAVGFVAFDAFPPREEGEDVWAEPVLDAARRLRKETGVVFASVAMGPLGYGPTGKRYVATGRLPFLQGHPRRAGRSARWSICRARVRGAFPTWRRTRTAGRHRRLLGGCRAAGRGARAVRCSSCTGCGGPRSGPPRHPRPRRRPPARSGSRGREGAGAGAAPQGQARRRPVGLLNPTDVEVAAAEVLRAARPSSGGGAARLVQRMAAGTEVLVGAVVDEAFGRLRHGAARRGAGRGRRRGVRRGAPHAAPRRSRSSARRLSLRALRGSPRSVARSRGRRVDRACRARSPWRLTSLEANPLLVNERGRSPWMPWPRPGLPRDLRTRRSPRVRPRRFRGSDRGPAASAACGP
jgi:hypothetical protein